MEPLARALTAHLASGAVVRVGTAYAATTEDGARFLLRLVDEEWATREGETVTINVFLASLVVQGQA